MNKYIKLKKSLKRNKTQAKMLQKQHLEIKAMRMYGVSSLLPEIPVYVNNEEGC